MSRASFERVYNVGESYDSNYITTTARVSSSILALTFLVFIKPLLKKDSICNSDFGGKKYFVFVQCFWKALKVTKRSFFTSALFFTLKSFFSNSVSGWAEIMWVFFHELPLLQHHRSIHSIIWKSNERTKKHHHIIIHFHCEFKKTL